ncbi:MAG: superfamily II RNA helicase [Chlamydiales bacterium]|jgi:superfamily II RNA helicase
MPSPDEKPARTRHRSGRPQPGREPGAAQPDPRTTHWKGFELSSFQVQAVHAIAQGRNVLVSAPTGAGKTLVAQYAIEDAVKRGRRAIYTSPIKALSNQKYRDFRDDPDIDVGLMTGDVTIHPAGRVLIMTTEILRNAIFENPELLSDVDFVIFDEVHYMDDRERGTVWEEALIFLPASVRLICLSATISNVDEIGEWLEKIRDHELEVIHSADRPVPLEYWFFLEGPGLVEASNLKKVVASMPPEPKRRRGQGGRGRKFGGGRGRPRSGHTHTEPSDPGALFDQLEKRELLPALVFSFSRKDCERLARANEERELLTPEEARRMDLLQRDLIDLFQLDSKEMHSRLFQMARRGVSYHHAGMLPVEKEVVERMFTAGLLKLLFTTETFALGINMPARAAVFQSLRKFDGITFDWLRTRDFMQMAGRAGRQGIDDKGVVVCRLSQRELLEAPVDRWMASEPEPVLSRFRLSYSTILHLVDRLGRDRVHEAWEKSFHQWQGREKKTSAREKNRRQQKRVIDSHINLLTDLGYLDGDKLTARGRVARIVNGFELQITEMLFRGVLENLPPRALAMAFVGLVFEDRRRFERSRVPQKLFGTLRYQISSVVADLCAGEVHHGIQPEMKRPDWGLTQASLAWADGCNLEDLEYETDATLGDVCRCFRMGVQLMRNVRRAIDPDWDLAPKLKEAVEQMNRDVIDARKQLELG